MQHDYEIKPGHEYRLTRNYPDLNYSDPTAWKDHFLHLMQPEHMPENWDIYIAGNR